MVSTQIAGRVLCPITDRAIPVPTVPVLSRLAHVLLFAAALFSGSIGLVILLLRSSDQRGRRFTTGMLAASVVGLLFVPWVGEENVDPAMQFMGSNTSYIMEALLTVAAGYSWVAASRASTCDPRNIWGWRVFSTAFAAALLITYLFSPQFRRPDIQFATRGTAALVNDWILVTWLILSGGLIVFGTLADHDGVTFPFAVLMHALLGVALAGAGIAIGTVLVVAPDWLRMHFDDLVQQFAAPGLFALGLAGLAGLREAWHRRNDPR